MNIGACSTYKTSNNCLFSKGDGTGPCVWLAATNTCVDKACTTADSSYTSDALCAGYITGGTAATRCTVGVVTVDSVKSAVGCQVVSTCLSYQMSDQCIVNAEGKFCAWNSTTNSCADKTCLTAPSTDAYNTDTLCKGYSSECTVASSGTGCVIRPDNCEGMTELQCINNKAGDLCYWNTTTLQCVTKTCSTAPESVSDAAACDTYLPGCTMDASIRCKIQVCEDFVFKTDSDCQKAKSGCTTNGVNCVTRTQCIGATVKEACVTQADTKECEWITTTSTCVLKTCATAPVAKILESDCVQYQQGCTTKSGGGCVTKSTCAAANVAAACTTASDNTVCVWDNGTCRNQACQDFSGTTHAACQAKGNCTAGSSGKCAATQTCEKTTIREACIKGSDGQPCLWINGACYSYTSCQSQLWPTDKQCKLISNQCTTNQSKCVAISSCAETNISGGCITGYDGNCIQTVPALNSSSSLICKVFTACTDAYFITYNDCQTASTQCTTNGVSSCAPLDACSTYTVKEACHKNAKGQVTSAGLITSTGVCSWDDTLSACRDQNCSDLKSITSHYQCQATLSGCTSDGTDCLAQAKCGTYTSQTICENAYGTDGPQGECTWDATLTPPACRIMACSDIKTGNTVTQACQGILSQCVSDGTNCILQAACSAYTTKIGCNSGGTDGPCVFTQSTATGAVAGTGTCKVMTACGDASNDQTACQSTLVKFRCSWSPSTTSGTNTTASKCATHSCSTYSATVGYCGNFLNWGKTLQQVCQTTNGTCTATDPTTLTADNCYTSTAYAYTWNAQTSKCGVCTAATTNTSNNTNTTTNTTNDTTTTSGYMLGFTSVILGYLMF